MNIQLRKRNSGMTLMEVIVVIAMLVILAAIILPVLAKAKHRTSRINCVSNLNQIGLSLRVWKGDNNDKFPMAFCVTNEAAMKLLESGNSGFLWQALSNELNTPKILICSDDNNHFAAKNFDGLVSSNISYFLNLDAAETSPQMIVLGDDNFTINSKPVKAGISTLRSSDSLAWQKNRHIDDRHVNYGNIGLTDGSVRQWKSAELNSNFVSSIAASNSPPINRFAIP